MAQIEKHYCLACGAALPAKVVGGRLKCEFCGTVYNLSGEKKHVAGEMTCPQCGSGNSTEAEFCGECGAALFHACPKCGTKNRVEVAFCVKCGAEIDQIKNQSDLIRKGNLEEIYQVYVQETIQLMKLYRKYYLPWSIVGLVLLILGYTLIQASRIQGLGIIIFFVALLTILIGALTSEGKVKRQALALESKMPGLAKFHKSFTSWGYVKWPRKLPDGKKREQFLEIIGRKS